MAYDDELDEVLDSFNPGPRARSCGDDKLADIYDRARSIRNRERKLAELAKDAQECYIALARRAKKWGCEPAPKVLDWLQRYEEAIK